jgi:hypothetical protein
LQTDVNDERTDATVPTASDGEGLVVDLDDPRPLISTGYRTIGLEPSHPVDLPQFSVYPDGRVIGVVIGSSSTQYTAYDLQLAPSDFEQLVESAAAVGLEGGRLQPEVPLPDGIAIEDGFDYYFAVRSNGEVTARVVEEPFENVVDGDENVPDRVGYGDFFRALLPLFEDLNEATLESRTPIPLRRWAIVSAPLGRDDERDTDQAWTGPDLNDVEWEPIAGGAVCVIVEDPEWPLDRADEVAPVVIDNRLVSRRPLLPHEQTCNDVSELRNALELDDLTGAGAAADLDVHATDRWTGGVDGPVIFGRFKPGAEGALVSATIQLRNGCLVVESPGTDDAIVRSLIVWKYGTVWVGDQTAVRLRQPLSGERDVLVGEFVELGGGYYDIESVGRFFDDPEALANIADCLGDPTISEIFVNQ